MDNANSPERPEREVAAGPPIIPDRIGTPGLTDGVDEGGKRVRAGYSATAAPPGAVQPPGPSGSATPGPGMPPAIGGPGPLSQPTAGDQPTLSLHEEVLRPCTRRVVTEDVVVRTRIVTERRQIDVEVRREELVLERQPRGEDQSTGTTAKEAPPDTTGRMLAEGETVTILLREDQVPIEKVPVVIEEVHSSRRLVTDRQPITGTVNREVVHVAQPSAASGREAVWQGTSAESAP